MTRTKSAKVKLEICLNFCGKVCLNLWIATLALLARNDTQKAQKILMTKSLGKNLPKFLQNLKKALKTSKLPKNLSQPSLRTLFDKGVEKRAWRKINFTFKKWHSKK